MKPEVFRKLLSANDAGETDTHQAGILVPKGNTELLAFLGTLNPEVKNPRRILIFVDERGVRHEFNFIYYNNSLHDPRGTRNEYRLTGMTKYLRNAGARSGDELELSKDLDGSHFRVRIIRQIRETNSDPQRIRLRGWRRIH